MNVEGINEYCRFCVDFYSVLPSLIKRMSYGDYEAFEKMLIDSGRLVGNFPDSEKLKQRCRKCDFEPPYTESFKSSVEFFREVWKELSSYPRPRRGRRFREISESIVLPGCLNSQQK